MEPAQGRERSVARRGTADACATCVSDERSSADDGSSPQEELAKVLTPSVVAAGPVQIRERVGKEVERVPEGEAVRRRALPVEGGESVAAGHQVPCP